MEERYNFLKCKSLYPLLVIPANLLRDVARLAGCLATHVHWDLQRARAATVQQHAAASLLLHSNTSLLAKKEYKYYLYLDGRPFHVDGTVPFFTSRLHVEAWMLCESVGARPTFYEGLPTNCCCSNTNLSISSPPPLPPSTLLVSIAFAIISALLCAKA